MCLCSFLALSEQAHMCVKSLNLIFYFEQFLLLKLILAGDRLFELQIMLAHGIHLIVVCSKSAFGIDMDYILLFSFCS